MTFIKRPTREELKQQLQGTPGSPSAAKHHDTDSDHAIIEKWMARLRLFYGVPFNYLVPDERMLPIESLRFFQVDDNWMEALVDGSLSIGASKPESSGSAVAVAAANLKFTAKQGVPLIRPQILSKGAEKYTEKAEADLQSPPVQVPQQISGFFLRSMVVTGWPGLEVFGFSDAACENPVPILRMELLSPSLLFVLFNGIIQAVTFQEPSEGVHFGVTPDTDPVTTELRYAASGEGVSSGELISTQENFQVPMRSNGNINVLRANTFAQQLIGQPTVWPPDTQSPYPPFTAAQFALELVQGVQSITFNINNPS